MSKIEGMESSLEGYLFQSAEIPNAPFLYGAAAKMVRAELGKMGFSDLKDETQPQNELQFTSDHFGIYARIKRGNPRRGIIITTHLDHPFVVLDGRGGGVPLGTIGNSRLKEIAGAGGIPIKVFSAEGEHITNDRIADVILGGKPRVKTEFVTSYPGNTHAIWDMSPIVVNRDKIKMINADNMASTAVALAVLKDLSSGYSDRDIDVEFVFAHLEEIKQSSATAIAMRGNTPFGDLGNRPIIVLESATMSTSRAYDEVLSKFKLPRADYNSGVLIRVNDANLVYGQRTLSPNLSEILLLKTADQLGIDYQHTLVDGVCDATAYTLFSPNPSIAGITIPTKYKHNWGPEGDIVHEELRTSDFIDMKSLVLQAVISAGGDALSWDHPGAITEHLKSTTIAANPRALASLQRDRVSALYSTIKRLKAGKFYPEGLVEEAGFLFDRVRGRVNRGI
jgi:hypothetical protein